MNSTNKKRVIIVGIAFFLFASVLLVMEFWRSDPGFRWWISQLTGTIDDNETSIFSGKTKNEERAIAINSNDDAGRFKDGSSIDIKETAQLCNDYLNGKAPRNNFCQNWKYVQDPEMQKAVMTVNGYTKILQSGNSINSVSQEEARNMVSDTPRQIAGQLPAIPPTPDGPYPFQRNCKAMQSYFNTSINWSDSVKFQDFESKKPEFYMDGAAMNCFGGYYTEITPVRKKVCKGYIRFNSKYNKGTYFSVTQLDRYDGHSDYTRCSFDPPLR